MEQSDLLAFAIDVLEQLDITYMLVGSLASGAYGEPRLTQDIDIVIDATPVQIRSLCQSFDPSEFYVSIEAALQALRTPAGQFNVIDPQSGNKIDFLIARKDPWGIEQIARRHKEQILPGKMGYAARPEDVIVGKMLYYQEGGSEKHLRDITGILKVSGDQIDHEYVETWAGRLALQHIWRAILDRLP